MIDNEFMHKLAKRLAQYSSELSGRHYVSVVLKYCLPVNAPYISGHVKALVWFWLIDETYLD